MTFSVTGDTGNKSGSQTLTLKQGSTLEHMTVILVGSTGYINGNTTALTDVIGLSKTAAKKYAGTWVSFSAAKQQYADLTAGLLDSQVSGELKMSGPYHYGKTKTINGKSATAIVGKVSDDSGNAVASTLYVADQRDAVAARADHRPLGQGDHLGHRRVHQVGPDRRPEGTGALYFGHEAAEAWPPRVRPRPRAESDERSGCGAARSTRPALRSDPAQV